MKERDYSTLLAGMRKAPTITDAEEVIRTQGKIKLPDRRSITLWDSPELSQFRGVNEDSEKAEEKRHVAQVEHLEAKQAASSQGTPLPDVQFVQQAAAAAQQQAAAMSQHVIDLENTSQHHQRAMAAELKAALDGMYQAQAGAANRQKMADEVARGFQNKHMADIQRLLEAREASVPSANIDSSVHHTTHQHNTVMQEQTVQNNLLNYISANLQGIGAQM